MKIYYLSIWGILLAFFIYLGVFAWLFNTKNKEKWEISGAFWFLNTVFLAYCIAGAIKLCGEFGC